MSPVEVVAFPVVFALGYVLGVVSGVTVWHRKLTREVAVQARVIKRWLDKWLMGFVGVFLIVVSLLMYHDQVQHNADTAKIAAQAKNIAASSLQVKLLGECVASYENRLSASLAPIRRATKRNGAADIAFKKAAAQLFIPGHDKRDVAAVKAALDHNLAVFTRLTDTRAKNPYPKPPKEVCPQ